MNKEYFSELLFKQKEKGRDLLSLISTMNESQNDFGDGMVLFGGEDLYYVPEAELDSFRNEFDGWKSYVLDLLSNQLGRDNQLVYEWDSKVITHVSKRKPILAQLSRNVNKGLSLLDNFIQRLDFYVSDKQEGTLDQDEKIKNPQVFISHASKDKNIVGAFSDFILKQGLGLEDKNIICTSFESTGVAPGENIPRYIIDKISHSAVFLSMVSNNYKASEVCMNEVGAALALDKNPIQIVLPRVEFNQLGWLIHLDKAARIDDPDSLDHLAEVICERLGIEMKTPLHWNAPKRLFLESIASSQKGAIDEKKSIAPNVKPVNKNEGDSSTGLKLFDSSFSSIYLTEGEYIIQLNVRLRAEKENVSLWHVFLKNEAIFSGSSISPLKEMELNSYLLQGQFELSNDKEKSITFVKDDYPKMMRNIVDMTVERGYSKSISFVHYLTTLRECDGYDDLQLGGWSLLVEYNVDDSIEIPLELKPVDKRLEGKYWHNTL